jgi:hypothetical protein
MRGTSRLAWLHKANVAARAVGPSLKRFASDRRKFGRIGIERSIGFPAGDDWGRELAAIAGSRPSGTRHIQTSGLADRHACSTERARDALDRGRPDIAAANGRRSLASGTLQAAATPPNNGLVSRRFPLI